MASIIKKRVSLHRDLVQKQHQNKELKLQLSRLHALANVGISTSMIAHEINNLMTPLSNYATLARQSPEDKDFVNKALSKIERNSRRVTDIMQSILAVVNGESCKRQFSDIAELLRDIFDCLSRDFSKDGITVRTEIQPDLKVWAVPIEIQQVLMNLILNARDAMLDTGGSLTIRGFQDGDNVHILLSDTGTGIKNEYIESIFEPFFTTKTKKPGSNSGSGLGLAFCKKVIDEHGGSISVQSKPGNGTVFSIILPGSQ